MAPKDLATIRPSNSNRTWSNKRVRARVFVEVNGVEVPIFKDGTMVVNPDKTLTSNLPYVLKYDDPLESDEEVDPRDPEDHIEEIDSTKLKPDLETEYRRAIRHTIRSKNILIIHS